MDNYVLVFPGQGSQYKGMSKDLYENGEVAKKLIDSADSVLDFDLKETMFEDSNNQLDFTEYTQPALLVHSVVAFEELKHRLSKFEKTFNYSVCLGLSLGEYSALVVAGKISFLNAVNLVRKRGKFMQDAVPVGEGTMAAILGLDRENVEKAIKLSLEELCKLKLESDSDKKDNTLNLDSNVSLKNDITIPVVEVANYNCPGQIVISGEVEAVRIAMEKCKELGAKKVIELNVSGPFHSSMLKSAGEKLLSELEKIDFLTSDKKVISNVNAQYYDNYNLNLNSTDTNNKNSTDTDNKNNYCDLLVKQVSSSVLWENSIEKLLDEGYDKFVEIGPGKTLKGFIKKIASKKGVKVEIYNIEDMKSIEKFIEIL
ncbi:MAG: ACP S-malonyltransferase [Clostridioides sp.]|jgi:[acyl-carrier-protein] S-malonyltransferase|nr:ACP S-malonyltransferase [Clostridioides sp.]